MCTDVLRQALEEIKDLDPGLWKTAQEIADNALKAVDSRVIPDTERDQIALEF